MIIKHRGTFENQITLIPFLLVNIVIPIVSKSLSHGFVGSPGSPQEGGQILLKLKANISALPSF